MRKGGDGKTGGAVTAHERSATTSLPPTQSELNAAEARLARLLNADPVAAIAAARRITARDVNSMHLRAAILCDGGAAVRDVTAVEEAVDIFSRIHDRLPKNGGIAYNLANALEADARLDTTPAPNWYLKTADRRRRARALLGQAANLLEEKDPVLASRAMTNLGNSLDAAYRWIEAFEAYQRALELYPSNGVASGCAAQMLFRVSSAPVLGHNAHLRDVAGRLAHHAQAHSKIVARLAGPRAIAAFRKLPSRSGGLARTALGKRPSAYERFVATNRLILSPIMEGLGHDRRRWDDAHLRGITEPVSTGPRVPPVFAMFNVMKADYLVARDLLFRGSVEANGSPRDTGLYFDTLDYATYGSTQSRLTLAQRSALDLLDKTAVALNDILSVGEKPQTVYFDDFWFAKASEPRWRRALAKAIQAGNPALVALSEIAADLSDVSQDGSIGGLLHAEKRARNAGTHRFIVLHDIAITDSRPNAAIEHHMLDAFQGTAMRTVRLARAALLHFLEVIAYAERSRDKKGPIGTMLVHTHHYIRGQR